MRHLPLRSLLTLLLLPAAAAIGTAQPSVEGEKLRITVEAADWHITLPRGDFRIEQEKYAPDGRGAYIFLTGRGSELNLSFFIEPAPAGRSAAEMRDAAWRKQEKGSGSAVDVTRGESGDGATIQYTVPSFGEMTINQRNLRVHYVRDGYWIDVHLSKIDAKESDRETFDRFAGTLGFASKNREKSTGLSLYCYQRGALAYTQKNYGRAIEWYEQSLALEKRERRLGANEWKVLIDNLGIAHALSGEMEQAREVFSYGITTDPDYPMFYYNLACTEAELGNMEGAITNLKSAFARRGNVIEGERMPNPRTDSSFKRYLDNARFTAVLKEIEEAGRE